MTCLPSVLARGVVSRYRGLCTQAPVSVAPALFTRLPFAGDGSLITDSLPTLESARAAVPVETAAEAGLAAETHRPRRSRRRRLVEYAVLAVVWIGLGLVLSLGLVPFLLLGAPLLVLFQLASSAAAPAVVAGRRRVRTRLGGEVARRGGVGRSTDGDAAAVAAAGPLRQRQLDRAGHGCCARRWLPRHPASRPHRHHRRARRRRYVLDARPRSGHGQKRRPRSPGPPRGATQHGHVVRV